MKVARKTREAHPAKVLVVDPRVESLDRTSRELRASGFRVVALSREPMLPLARVPGG